jgi:transposase
MFERLKGKGKNGRVALNAVGNKLLKQCFAVATSGVPFDPNYQKEISMN